MGCLQQCNELLTVDFQAPGAEIPPVLASRLRVGAGMPAAWTSGRGLRGTEAVLGHAARGAGVQVGRFAEQPRALASFTLPAPASLLPLSCNCTHGPAAGASRLQPCRRWLTPTPTENAHNPRANRFLQSLPSQQECSHTQAVPISANSKLVRRERIKGRHLSNSDKVDRLYTGVALRF